MVAEKETEKKEKRPSPLEELSLGAALRFSVNDFVLLTQRLRPLAAKAAGRNDKKRAHEKAESTSA